MSESFLNGRVVLHAGDCADVVRKLAANSVDAVVTDPPYVLESIVKRFGSKKSKAAKATGATGVYKRSSRGFMGQEWDTGDVAHSAKFWRSVKRVLKPGGYVVAFAGTRTYHRLAVAIEDAGFEIRDMLSWLYASGFPKSHDVERSIAVCTCRLPGRHFKNRVPEKGNEKNPPQPGDHVCPMTPESAPYEGWGTALKPACEPICLARKPLSEPSVAANVLRWGTGGLSIDACRIATDEVREKDSVRAGYDGFGTFVESGGGARSTGGGANNLLGRWPANVLLDGSGEVVAAFPDSDGQRGDASPDAPSARTGLVYGKMNRHGEKSASSRYELHGNSGPLPGMRRFDTGSASRFFWNAKADDSDRLGSGHPTVKPLDLMEYLCRLVCPPGGVVLEPFAGSGTTGEAAFRAGLSAVLIERETKFQDDIRRRMRLVMSGPDERRRETVKAKQGDRPIDLGPLFGGEG